jgi:hypothetical protein
MHIDAFICDAVTVREGLLHVLGGGITILNRKEFPAPLSMSIAATLAVNNAGVYVVSVTVRADGSDVVLDSVTGSIVARASASDDDAVIAPFIITLGQTTVPIPGKYLIDIAVDSKLLRTLWFRVREPPSPSVSPSPTPA